MCTSLVKSRQDTEGKTKFFGSETCCQLQRVICESGESAVKKKLKVTFRSKDRTDEVATQSDNKMRFLKLEKYMFDLINNNIGQGWYDKCMDCSLSTLEK